MVGALLSATLFLSVFLLVETGMVVAAAVFGTLLVVGLEYALSSWGTEVPFETVPVADSEHADLLAVLSATDCSVPERLQLAIGRTHTPASFVRYTPDGLTLVVTDGLIRTLDADELRAILVHEVAHVEHYHPQMYLLGQAVSVVAGFAVFWVVVLQGVGSWLTVAGSLAFGMLWLGGGNATLSVARHALSFGTELGVLSLVMALSRNNEYLADEVVESAGYRRGLISALETVESVGAPSLEAGSATVDSPAPIRKLMRSHPPIAARIHRLERRTP